MKPLSSSASQRPRHLLLLTAIFCALSLAQLSSAQQYPTYQLSSVLTPLITQPIDESQLTLLKGNTYPLARPQFDLGSASATLPMRRMLLVLKRSAAQESTLRQLLDNQQDKSSPSYHKWLTPEEFGKQFGPTDADMQTVTAWLQSYGFQVGTTKGRTVLEFSGSAGQVQEAFHTTIHKYIVNGEQHWANSSDPSIPTALTPAVAGVLTLHNFLKKPQIHVSPHPVSAHITQRNRPQITFSDGTHALTPADYDTIYNINSVLVSNNGDDVGIGVVARSNLYVEDSGFSTDVNDFRQVFLPDAPPVASNFNVYLNGPDPGDLGGSEEAEVTLDATWAGAIASGATVDLRVSASTNTSDGIELSEVAIIENNYEGIMTESFGSCEAQSTASNAAGDAALAEQAAAQGITYLVSAGDSGAEGCDDPDTETVASGPISVNVLASTPFNTAVGGTMFNENGQSSTYWSSTSSSVGESVISYIPEDVWNESCTGDNCASGDNPGIWAGGGGASIYSRTKPSWQSGVTGIPQDNARDLPDVSLTAAASHDPYVLCLEGSCFPNGSGNIELFLVGGTSASAPSFASIMALVVEQVGVASANLGQRVGLANYVLYRLAAAENGTFSRCNASNTSGLPASTCVFNDVTMGNNAVPGEINYGSSTADYQAGAGYDMASGLGSVNVANLVNQWNSVTFSPTMTTLNITEQTVMHGSSVPFTVSVSPTSGTGTPTGDVSLLSSSNGEAVFNNTVGMFTLADGSIVSSTSNLPGAVGVSELEAYYTGDATYAPSYSGQTPIDVTPEPSTTTLSVLTVNSLGNFAPFTGGPFGSFVYLRADVAGVSGHGTPSGSVTFSDTFGPIPGGSVYQLNGGDQPNSGAYTATPNGILTFNAGAHTISASYSGDASFNPSSSTQSLSFTIRPGFLAAVPSNQSQVTISAPGSSGSTSVSVSSSTGFSGTITLSCSGLPSGAACQFTPSSIAATGAPTTTSSAITVTTTAAATAMLKSLRRPHVRNWLALGSFMFFSLLLIGAPKRQRLPQLLLATLALILLAPGCGGGGASGVQSPPPNPGTAAGTYSVVVTATSGTTISTTGFTLLVQ